MTRFSSLQRPLAFALSALLAVPPAFAQLPDLGHSAQESLSPVDEQRIAEEVLRQIRFREPAYVNDAEIEEYLAALGQRLLAAAPGNSVDYRFFLLRDPSVNAFAMPGGVIGFHTGLLMTTQTESELASVMAHEISHVSQHHIARMLSMQGRNTAMVLAAILVAVLAGRNSTNTANAVLAGGQALAVQNQLAYSRDYEREADRIGLQMLMGAGFDPQGMPDFLTRLHAQTRSLDNASGAYLSTHPLTQDRIADVAERVRQIGPRPAAPSLDFHLLRSKVEVMQLGARTAIPVFRERKADDAIGRAAILYGLTRAYLADHQPEEAAKSLARLQALKLDSVLLVSLAADVASARGQHADAAQLCRDARQRFAGRASLQYCEAEAWLAGGQPAQALRVVDPLLRVLSSDYRLYMLQAKANTQLGRSTEAHRAQAEVYALQADYAGAIDQLELARRAGGGDHIEQAAMDARLRELRALHSERLKKR